MTVLLSLASICLATVCLYICIGHSTAYRRVCYITNWSQHRNGPARWVPEDLDASLCTHVIFAFGEVEDSAVNPVEGNDHSQTGDHLWALPSNSWRGFRRPRDAKRIFGAGGHRESSTQWHNGQSYTGNDRSTYSRRGMYERLNNMKAQNPQLKTLLAIGGLTQGSRPFSAMASRASSRRQFVQNTVSYLRRWNFDGLDVDWKYPSSEDRERFVLLLQDLRRAFEAEATRSGNDRLLLGIAGPGVKATLDAGYNIPRIANAVDFINVMTYGYHNRRERVTGMNAPLTGRAGETAGNELLNVEYSAEYYVRLGAPREKLNIGLALYGNSFTLTSRRNHGVGASVRRSGQPGRYTRERGFLAYFEICRMLQQGATRYWHAEHQCPYAVRRKQWVSYDDPESLELKINYIKRGNYGGSMVWTADLDDFQNICGRGRYPLMHTIHNLLNGTGPLITTASTSVTSSYTETTQAQHTTDTPQTSVPSYTDRTTDTPQTSYTDGTTQTPQTTHTDGTTQTPQTSYTEEPSQTPETAYTDETTHAPQTSYTEETTQPPDTHTSDGTTRTPLPPQTTAPMTMPAIYDCQRRGNGVYADPVSCAAYFLCVDGSKFELKCGDGRLFDTTLHLCTDDYKVNCGSRPRSPLGTNPTTRRQTPPVIITLSTGTHSSAPVTMPVIHNCQRRGNGVYPDSISCVAYFLCVSGTKFELQCGDGLLFDTTLHSCTDDYTVNCGSRSRSTLGTSPTIRRQTPPVTTTHPTRRNSTDPQSDFCANRPDGTYRIANNCGWFYHCSHNVAYLKACAEGTVFDERIGVCNHRGQVLGC